LVMSKFKEFVSFSRLFSRKMGPKVYMSSQVISRVLLTTSVQNSSSR
jgi:hypothetical protein